MIVAGLLALCAGAVLTVTAGGGGGAADTGLRASGITLLALGGVLLIAGLARRRVRTRLRSGVPGAPGARSMSDVRDAVYRTGRGRMTAMIIAFLYIVSPIDLIPDFFLPIGVVDDATALGWLLFAVGQEVTRRRRATRMAGVDGTVPPQVTTARRRSPR